MAEAYEQTLALINQCFVYKLPPRTTTGDHRAAEWNAADPLWSGKLKVIAKGDACIVQLIDSTSGELFAVCPVDDTAVEPVKDSSRYFVLRIENQGRHAFIGLGFAERNEAFDFNVALQDHKKYLKNKEESAKALERLKNEPDVDYTLKGPIKVSLNVPSGGSSSGSKLAAVADDDNDDAAFIGLLAPPPKAKTSVTTPAASSSSTTTAAASNNADPFGSFAGFGNSNNSTNNGNAGGSDWMSF
mmetsp:Transcript_18487/g.32109  ORF Transcript_18487/g.32109 Transcript_18487/m.32109 type:complete len:244 (-) Transcript_18487:11-742(-)